MDGIPEQLRIYKENEDLWKLNNIDNVWITPNGLWVNGVSLERGQFAVILDDGNVVILNLTEDEQRKLTPRIVVKSLSSTSFYKNRIFPLLHKRGEPLVK